MGKKVLIITYYWPPAGGPGVQRWLKFVKYLPEFGIQPFVLSVDEKYAGYPFFDRTHINDIDASYIFKTKTFEFFSVYQKIFRKKDIPHSGFVNEGSPTFSDKCIRFLRSNLFIPDPRKGWNRYAFKKAIEIIEKENIETIITTSPPHSTQLIGLKIKKYFPEVKWISDLRDPWTDIYYYDQLYHSFLSNRFDKKHERNVILGSDKIIVVTKHMKNRLLSRMDGLNEEKINVVRNGYDLEDFTGKNEALPQEFTVTYTGTLAWNYDIEIFLCAIKRLSEEGMKIKIRFIGTLSDNWEKRIHELNLISTTEIIPTVSHNDVISFLLSSHVLLLVIPKNKGNESIVTGKIFEYIGAKRPIVGIGPVDGEAASIINKYTLGAMFDYDDMEGVKKFLQKAFDDKTRKHVRSLSDELSKKFTRRNQTKKLVELLD